MMSPIEYQCARISVQLLQDGDENGARVWSWLMESAKKLGL